MKQRIEQQYRETVTINDFWNFHTDPQKVGEDENWVEISKDDWDKLYVPANWNEQAAEYQWYMGTAWYARDFYVPEAWEGKLCWIHFEAVLYRSKVWVNGTYLGEYEGGFLPFEFRIEDVVEFGKENHVVLQVNNELDEETVPAATIDKIDNKYGQVLDFFHYGGIHRDVCIRCSDHVYVDDTTIVTDIEEGNGSVAVSTVISNQSDETRNITLRYNICDRNDVVAESVKENIEIAAKSELVLSDKLIVENARLWDVEEPNLYTLQTVLQKEEDILDLTNERFGIRTVEVKDGKIYLNGRKIFLKGVSGHEDFPILGKAVNGAILRRDFDLLKKVGANSFRTTHYPYTRIHLDLADEYGFLVIDELVWLKINSYASPVLKEKMARMLKEMIKRDKNHPSIFMYNVTNEPVSIADDFRPFIKDLIEVCRDADPTRPAIYVSDRFLEGDTNFDLVDVICHNAYFGWYPHYKNCEGDIERAMQELSVFLDDLHAAYPDKPIMLTEFGADSICGYHSDPPEMWTEEFQSELLKRTLEVALSKPYMAGVSVWNLCDYRTPQGYIRTKHNRKGLFTRVRDPKMAAKTVQEIYQNISNYSE